MRLTSLFIGILFMLVGAFCIYCFVLSFPAGEIDMAIGLLIFTVVVLFLGVRLLQTGVKHHRKMGRAEYLELLKPIVAEYRQHSYTFWRSRVGDEPITLQNSTSDGTEYQVEIEAFWDEFPDGDIRVLFSIDDGGWRAFIPVCEDFIISPGADLIGE